MGKYKIVNGNIITPYRMIKKGTVLINDGKVEYVGKQDVSAEDYEKIDACGNFVSPGFIDIHIHGGGGHNFIDSTEEAYLGVAEMHASHGTTSMVVTNGTSTSEEIKESFEVYRRAKKLNKKGSQFLGVHLEGPYFAMSQRGAQDPRYIRNPEPDDYKKIMSWSDDIVRWSAAPELEGICEFGSCLVNNGILPSIGHTDAVYEDVKLAFEYGFKHITHLYSATSNVRRIDAYRYAGVTESAYIIDEMTVEIIADGHHLPASLLKMIYKIKGPSRTALITDSIRGAGMPEGDSIGGSLKNGRRIIIEGGVAKLPDRTAFAGSVATTDRLVRNMVNMADVPLIDAVRMMTSTPANIMGVNNKKGSLVNGKDADIVIFDDNINIKMVMIEGNVTGDGSLSHSGHSRQSDSV